MENLTTIRELMQEKHSLIEWMVLLQKYPELREEFDKMAPPPRPIE